MTLLFVLWLSAQVSTVAGTGVAGFTDGPAREAAFNRPTWLDVLSGPNCSGATTGDIFVIDRLNNVIRRISNGGVSTYTVRRHWSDSTEVRFDFGGPFGGGIVMEPATGGCGCVEYDRGMFVSSSGSDQVMLVSIVGILGNRDGLQIVRGLQIPTGLARSWDYSRDFARRALYIADTGSRTVRRATFRYSLEGCPEIAEVTTLPVRFHAPRGIAAAPDGTVFVADSGDHVVYRIAPDSTVTAIGAGELHSPSGIDVNLMGEVFIADTGNHVIRMLTTEGRLVTIAGVPGVAGYVDGAAGEALFSGPVGLKVAPDGSLLVADTSNHVIRRITPPTKLRTVRR